MVRISKVSLCDVFPAKRVRTCFRLSMSACSQGHMLELTNQPSAEGKETHTQVIPYFQIQNTTHKSCISKVAYLFTSQHFQSSLNTPAVKEELCCHSDQLTARHPVFIPHNPLQSDELDVQSEHHTDQLYSLSTCKTYSIQSKVYYCIACFYKQDTHPPYSTLVSCGT